MVSDFASIQVSQIVSGPRRSYPSYGLRFWARPFFSLPWSQMAGSGSLGHLRQPESNSTTSTTMWLQQLPVLRIHASLAKKHQGQARQDAPQSSLQGKMPQPILSDQMPLTFPSLTQRYQGPAATLQTGWLTLLFLAVGPAHFISKCSWLQNLRVSHLHSQPEI